MSETLRDGESWSGKKAFIGQTFGAKKKKAAQYEIIRRLELKNHDLEIILALILLIFYKYKNLEEYSEAQLKIEDMLEEKPQHRNKYGTHSPPSFKKETVQGYNFSRTSCY